jgi:integrase/recombinase XerD
VLFFCGLRASEMVALDYPRDIDLARRELTVAHAKGKKWRRVPFDVKTKAALTEYIALERGKDPGPLFLSRGGSRVTYNALKMLMRRLEERCGAEITAHAFRRGFADKVLEQGVDPISTANLLGHSGLEMVRHYAKAGESRRAIASYRERVG